MAITSTISASRAGLGSVVVTDTGTRDAFMVSNVGAEFDTVPVSGGGRILLAEGFDPYGTAADMDTVGWAHGGVSLTATTPFSQGLALNFAGGTATTYNWGSNETTVYGSLFLSTRGTSSSSNYTYLSLTDGGTAQVTIRWNIDGSIGLYTGGPGGTLISTTTSVFTGGSTGPWTSFQFKVVISSAGSIELRVNGAPSNTITSTGINTRGGTSNVYANGVSMAASSVSGNTYWDNLFLTTTGWLGEMRALQQIPTSVVTPNFSVSPTTTVTSVGNAIGIQSCTNGLSYYCGFVSITTGSISSISFQANAGATANVKMSIFDNTGPSGPGTALGSANVVVNPVIGLNTFTFSTPVPVTNGITYWLGWSEDATVVWKSSNTGTINAGSFIIQSSVTTYASFPASNPTPLTNASNTPAAAITFTNINVSGVYQLTEDGDTSYIYANSNVEDRYNLSSIASTYSVTAVQYYACWKRADVGFRSGSLSVAANGSADTNLVTVTPPLSYAYTIATQALDPTGAAWTPATINGAIIGISTGS